MEQTVNERIRLIYESKNLTENRFSQMCGIRQGTVNGWKTKDKLPGLESLLQILATFPDVSAEWLLRGEGEMIKNNSSNVNAGVNNYIGGNVTSNVSNVGNDLHKLTWVARMVAAIVRACPDRDIQDKIIGEIEKVNMNN